MVIMTSSRPAMSFVPPVVTGPEGADVVPTINTKVPQHYLKGAEEPWRRFAAASGVISGGGFWRNLPGRTL